MLRCVVDSSIDRLVVDGFAFPLGVYPVEPVKPVQGYTVDFEQADGGEEDEWEEWPDRYLYDIAIKAPRLGALVRSLLSLMPHYVYPILDVLGRDAYREVDPYVSYTIVGLDRVIHSLHSFPGLFLEDGLCGFGAMADDPFLYIFVDEHKIVTLRVQADMKERVERVLKAFDLGEVPEIAGADAVAHEHRSVLLAPPDRPDLLNVDELVEHLREDWMLTLNIDPETNVDDDGTELGVSAWRCIVRSSEPGKPDRYAEVLLTAGCLRAAEDAALQGAEPLLSKQSSGESEQVVVASDRVTPQEFGDFLEDREFAKTFRPDGSEERIFRARWLE